MNNAKNILIIRFSSLGDIVLTSALIRALNHNHSPHRLYFLTKERYVELLQFFDHPINPIEYTTIHEKPGGFFKLAKEINRLEIDLIIDLHNNLRSNLLVPLISAPKKLKVDKRRKARKNLIRMKLNPSPPIAMYKLFQAPLTELGLGHEALLPTLNVTSEKKTKLVGIHPFANHIGKEWPLDKYIQLTTQLLHDGYAVRFFLPAGKACHKLPAETELYNNLSLSDLVLRIAECTYFIGNDSGPVHIAAATGANTIAIFGSTDPRLGFRPVGSGNHRVVQNHLKCRPCSLHGALKCRKDFKCLRSVEIADVLNAFAQIAGSAPRRS